MCRAPRPHPGLHGCRSSAAWALATGQGPWEGALARLGMFLLHNRTAFGLLLPALFSPGGETWFGPGSAGAAGKGR